MDSMGRGIMPRPAPPEKVATKGELDTAIADAYSKGWNAALDEALRAFDRSNTRGQFLGNLDNLGWIH